MGNSENFAKLRLSREIGYALYAFFDHLALFMILIEFVQAERSLIPFTVSSSNTAEWTSEVMHSAPINCFGGAGEGATSTK